MRPFLEIPWGVLTGLHLFLLYKFTSILPTLNRCRLRMSIFWPLKIKINMISNRPPSIKIKQFHNLRRVTVSRENVLNYLKNKFILNNECLTWGEGWSKMLIKIKPNFNKINCTLVLVLSQDLEFLTHSAQTSLIMARSLFLGLHYFEIKNG